MATPSKQQAANDKGNYELKVGKINLKLTNLHKIYWPDEGITKGELVNYYTEIADVILPYLKDRPESLHRFPNGIKGTSFYQKDFDINNIPEWLSTQEIYSESNRANVDYLVCSDKATLLYMANLACIEINPWNSRLKNLDKPDWLVIDLDPENIPFTEVVKTAQVTKGILDELEIVGLCKTSGATGLHIFIPMGARYHYDSVRNLAHLLAQKIHERLPNTTSLERQPKKRQKKVYPDFLQNSKGQTLAAPYSVRPRPGAPVSTPLQWSEVNAKLDPGNFTIKTIFKRLDKLGDIWKPVLGKGADLNKVLEKIEAGNK